MQPLCTLYMCMHRTLLIQPVGLYKGAGNCHQSVKEFQSTPKLAGCMNNGLRIDCCFYIHIRISNQYSW